MKPSKFKNLPPNAIENWVDKHFDYKKRSGRNGYELVLANPFYHNDNKKFNISLDRGVCHDWRGDDNWAGPINPETGKRNCSFIKFVRLYLKCTYKEALESILGSSGDISGYLNPESRLTDKESKTEFSVTLPNGARLLSGSTDKQAMALNKWLGSRGYTPEDIGKYELYHLGMDVYWPYYEFDTLVYWQSRSRLNKRFNFPELDVYDRSGKIIGVTSGSKGDFIYGFDDIDPASYIIVTEAIFDKHVLGKQTCASGGAILTPNQIKKIRILGPRDGVILAPDNDKAGIKSIVANTVLLQRQGFKVFYSIPPKLKYEKDGETLETKDWNEFFAGVGLTTTEIRALHDDNIKLASKKNLVTLRSELYVDKNKKYRS